MEKDKLIQFEAIKFKYIDDSDGEATLILKVNMQDKLSAFAIPIKERLKISVEVLK